MKNARMSPKTRIKMTLPSLRERVSEINASLKKTEIRLQYKTANGQEKGVSNLINKRARLLDEQREVLTDIEKLLGLEDEDDG